VVLCAPLIPERAGWAGRRASGGSRHPQRSRVAPA